MGEEKKLFHTFKKLSGLSARTDLSHQEKLHHLLMEIVCALNAESGSIMTQSGRKYLRVRASTKPELVGVRQALAEASPSAWVFENKKPLCVDKENPFEANGREKRKYKKDAYLLAPVIRADKVIGIIGVTDKKGEDQFGAGERSIFLDFAGLIISDVENYRLAESLKKKTEKLQEKNRELKKLEDLRKELFNMLIHDLKGLLSNVMASIDILSYTVDGENLEYVTAAQTGCDTLFRMTSNLLDIARLEEGSMRLIHEKLRADELLAEAVSRVHVIARTREVTVSTIPSDSAVPVTFDGDRGLLLRVFQNLIINGIHHSKPGETVTVSFDIPEKGCIAFRVRDKGPGVAKEYQEAIFDKYFQVCKKSDGRVYSTGLGLAFCKMAAEAHGGSIHVESDGKTGSCFVVTIPLA